MSQPVWKLLDNLGDENPIDHGSMFIFTDETGVYAPELEILESVDDERWEVRRFILEPCTYGRVVNGEFQPLDHYEPDGVLSDNPFHPGHAAWFAQPESERKKRPQDTTYLKNIARFIGMDIWELVQHFTSDDLRLRAFAYKAVADYHGIENFDEYPLRFKNREEVCRRYNNRWN